MKNRLKRINVNGVEMLEIESWEQLERLFLEASRRTEGAREEGERAKPKRGKQAKGSKTRKR